eukprot:8111821-Alexandrium_andersonii.AAC.1
MKSGSTPARTSLQMPLSPPLQLTRAAKATRSLVEMTCLDAGPAHEAGTGGTGGNGRGADCSTDLAWNFLPRFSELRLSKS